MNYFERLVQILSILSSDEREKTISEIIIYQLFHYTELDESQITKKISENFTVKLDEIEVRGALTSLVVDHSIEIIKGNYKLSEETKSILVAQTNEHNERQNKLEEIFKAQIKSDFPQLTEENIINLYNIFREYVFECVYLFGKEVVSYFNNTVEESNDQKSQILKKLILKLKDEQEISSFKVYINNFPNNLSQPQIDYINDLALNAEKFYSLGLPKNLMKDEDILNWVIFLDTNVLYSILNLHSHPDNEVCNKIIELCNSDSNNIKIKFKYLQKTQEEFNKKKEFFEKNIPRTIYHESQIRAMLSSEKLDPFTEMYLKRMLVEKKNTAHPSEIISNKIKILRNKQIEINRKDVSTVDEFSEVFMDQISEFRKYEDILNDVKTVKGVYNLKRKDLDKIEHDVYFRECVKKFRIVKPSTFNQCKYFGLTLDNILIKYDKYALKKEPQTADYLIPTFFSPAFLYAKLIKFLPIQTEDYKKAFIQAITAPLRKDYDLKKSASILKTVSKFNSLGIQNESLILDSLTDDIFIEKIGSGIELSNTDKNLIENAISIRLSDLEKEVRILSARYKSVTSDQEKGLEIINKKDNENYKLKIKIDDKDKMIKLYQKELQKTRNRLDNIKPPTGLQLSIPNSNIDFSKELNDENLQEKIINWSLLRSKLKSMLLFFKSIAMVINIIFAILFLLVAISDSTLTQNYAIFAGFIFLPLTLKKIIKFNDIYSYLAVLVINIVILKVNYDAVFGGLAQLVEFVFN